MAWKTVVTKIDHPCTICNKVIPAGTRCPSESRPDASGVWRTRHRCPSLSCYFPPHERAKLLAAPRIEQLSFIGDNPSHDERR